MIADAGSSVGARGTLSSFSPASCGRRLPLRAFTSLLDHTRFSHASLPPRERGTTWSRLPSSGFSSVPVYWQRLPSRSRIVLAQSFGRFFGTLAKFTATITVGTRIGPRTVCTALSCGRSGAGLLWLQLRKNGGRERTCTSKARRFSICGVCYSLLTTRPKDTQMEPPAGAAPARLSYKGSRQRFCKEAENGRSPQCCPGHDGLMLSAVVSYAELVRPFRAH